MTPAWDGYLLGLALLMALGPKDVFVIRNSVTWGRVAALVLICAGADALLIGVGVLGLGAVVTRNDWLMVPVMAVSMVYLLYFGVQAFRSSLTSEAGAQKVLVSARTVHSRRQMLNGALVHSLLTPYAWIDTVIMIGSMSAAQAASDRMPFALGAVAASLSWFLALATASRLSVEWLSRRAVWRVLDFIVGLSMLALMTSLAPELTQH